MGPTYVVGLNCNVTQVSNLEIHRFFLPTNTNMSSICLKYMLRKFLRLRAETHLYPKSAEHLSGEDREWGRGEKRVGQKGRETESDQSMARTMKPSRILSVLK